MGNWLDVSVLGKKRNIRIGVVGCRKDNEFALLSGNYIQVVWFIGSSLFLMELRKKLRL